MSERDAVLMFSAYVRRERSYPSATNWISECALSPQDARVYYMDPGFKALVRDLPDLDFLLSAEDVASAGAAAGSPADATRGREAAS
jgi:hypothetical protein